MSVTHPIVTVIKETQKTFAFGRQMVLLLLLLPCREEEKGKKRRHFAQNLSPFCNNANSMWRYKAKKKFDTRIFFLILHNKQKFIVYSQVEGVTQSIWSNLCSTLTQSLKKMTNIQLIPDTFQQNWFSTSSEAINFIEKSLEWIEFLSFFWPIELT